VLRPQTHTIATAKQSCVCTEILIYCYKNAQKLLPLELLPLAQIYAPNRLSAGALPQTHWESLCRSPRPLAGLWVGPRGTGRREGRGKGGRGGQGEEGRGGRPGMPKSRVGKPTRAQFGRKLRPLPPCRRLCICLCFRCFDAVG